MNIVLKKIADIKPYEKNPRKNDEAVKYVSESIKEFGFKVPIVVDKDNVIVAGHTRYKAAKKLKMTEVPCIVADDLTDEQIKAFRLADNKVSEKAEWDFDLLSGELDELIDFDMTVFGFEDDVTEEEPEVQEDDFEAELPEEPKAKLGDIYQLGNHRLMCGDSTLIDDVEKLMNGEKADMVFTDPPYNMSDNMSGFLSDESRESLCKIVDFEPESIINSLIAINTENYFLFTSKNLIPRYFEMFKGYEFNILVWCKDNPTPIIPFCWMLSIFCTFIKRVECGIMAWMHLYTENIIIQTKWKAEKKPGMFTQQLSR